VVYVRTSCKLAMSSMNALFFISSQATSQVIFAEGGVTIDGGPVLVVPCCSNMGGGEAGPNS
jgi:hypothetical protein